MHMVWLSGVRKYGLVRMVRLSGVMQDGLIIRCITGWFVYQAYSRTVYLLGV